MYRLIHRILRIAISAVGLSCFVNATAEDPSSVKVSRYLVQRGVIHRGFELEIPETAVVRGEDFAKAAELGRIDRLACFSKTITSQGLVDLLSKLKSLRWVTLAGPAVDDRVIAALGNHAASLEDVSLAGPFRGDDLHSLLGIGTTQPLTSLRLDCEPVPPQGNRIGATFGLTAGAVEHIAKLRGLRTLSLRGCGLTDDNLAKLHSLSDLLVLEVDGNPITGKGLTNLKSLTRLEQLTISSCRLTDGGLDDFPHLPSLQMLRLSNNQIGDAAIEAIGRANVDELTSLYLDRTDITDQALQAIGRMPNIQDLSLDGTRIDGSGLAQLSSVMLRALSVSSTRFSMASLDKLQELRNLEALNVCSTTLTDDAIPALAKLKQLRVLYSANTQISTAAAESLSKSLPECRIEMRDEPRLIPAFELIPGGTLPSD